MRKTPLKRTGPIKRKPSKKTAKPTAAKIKTCRECGYRGKIWSAGLCRRCAGSRKPENGEITSAMVDQVFSWLVRTLYPNHCHACKKQLPYKLLQCCHMVPRANMVIRWDLRNCYPGCESCNFHDPTHEILLAAECDRYWGMGTAEKITLASKKAYHWAPFELEELHEIFSQALREAQVPGANKLEIRIKTLERTRRTL